nr:limbic system-associated membrane protein-like [Nomia melanderi]
MACLIQSLGCLYSPPLAGTWLPSQVRGNATLCSFSGKSLCSNLQCMLVKAAGTCVCIVTTIPDPEFVADIGNKTVPAGRNVKLDCSVKDLGLYKVAWMLFDKGAILTVQHHVITRNPRISVSHDKHRTWSLHIKEVQEDDEGKYMCQINTATAKTQYGYLHVVVPPNIEDFQTSSDAVVRENANVSLTCKATGRPKPSIIWKRDDGSMININKTLSVLEWPGETLEMTRISRLDMGVYLCIATNGVPPSVSKQIKVSVDCEYILNYCQHCAEIVLTRRQTSRITRDPSTLNVHERFAAKRLGDVLE